MCFGNFLKETFQKGFWNYPLELAALRANREPFVILQTYRRLDVSVYLLNAISLCNDNWHAWIPITFPLLIIVFFKWEIYRIEKIKALIAIYHKIQFFSQTTHQRKSNVSLPEIIFYRHRLRHKHIPQWPLIYLLAGVMSLFSDYFTGKNLTTAQLNNCLPWKEISRAYSWAEMKVYVYLNEQIKLSSLVIFWFFLLKSSLLSSSASFVFICTTYYGLLSI